MKKVRYLSENHAMKYALWIVIFNLALAVIMLVLAVMTYMNWM